MYRHHLSQSLGFYPWTENVREGSGIFCLRFVGCEDASASGRKADGAVPRGKLLPRGDVLILGGDLAYPNPSTETYELRFVGPFEQALPPPPVSPFNHPLNAFSQTQGCCGSICFRTSSGFGMH